MPQLRTTSLLVAMASSASFPADTSEYALMAELQPLPHFTDRWESVDPPQYTVLQLRSLQMDDCVGMMVASKVIPQLYEVTNTPTAGRGRQLSAAALHMLSKVTRTRARPLWITSSCTCLTCSVRSRRC
jgi:hypothetical protein